MRLPSLKKRNQQNNSWLIVGLGNPGPNYQQNRHNVGQMVVNLLAERSGLKFKSHRTNSMVAEFKLLSPSPIGVVLAKSNSYMNRSGGPVAALSKYFSIPASRIVIVHDELDLPFESLKIKTGGGHAGHNGLRDIISALGTNEFHRLRVGIGRPPGEMVVADFVLRDYLGIEKKHLPLQLALAADTAEIIVSEGIAAAMQKLHSN